MHDAFNEIIDRLIESGMEAIHTFRHKYVFKLFISLYYKQKPKT